MTNPNPHTRTPGTDHMIVETEPRVSGSFHGVSFSALASVGQERLEKLTHAIAEVACAQGFDPRDLSIDVSPIGPIKVSSITVKVPRKTSR